IDAESGEPAPHVWNAALAEGVAFDPRASRALVVGSACGLCGTRVLEDLRDGLPRAIAAPMDVEPERLRAAFAELRSQQPLFARTAGTHGAALAFAERDGALALHDLAEDVGRHNAADKVLGAALRSGHYPLERPAWLLVSGRISYEIVQKAALAGVGAVAGVGMPTTLAVSAARACGLILHGFVREGGGLRYAPEAD
ncbi:MAG: formate dehydrogenase accessory sulfurtransferase FdhD, partial [Planctomycetota bacterium]|nr:formate dehydrogenase accessory sulfurtransferase FdhD [Planctomycetota bacterium]